MVTLMKDKKCFLCGSNLIKFGSNISCSNLNCRNNISDDNECIYIDFYGPVRDLDLQFSDDIYGDYTMDYDNFLYFSDRPDYISRMEFRKMNDFIEDTLFNGNQIHIEKRFLNSDEVKNFDDIEKKYEYMNRGRELEHESPEKALKFYEELLNCKLFKNDYYIYKKIVIFQRNPQKQLEYIVSFFESGIYCNRYHYLFFLKRLNQLSEMIFVSDETIDYCLRKFKHFGFKRKRYQDTPVPIAEKIRLNHGVLKVSTEEEYSLRQFAYELLEEASNLRNIKQYEYAIGIWKSLIWDKGFKSVKIFKAIRNAYHKLGDYENELKWIFGFFSKARKPNSKSYWEFVEKLDAFNIKTNRFSHDELFFDTNEHYLTKQDFKDNPVRFKDFHDYIYLVKFKYSMIRKGRKLEEIDIHEAITYYKNLIIHKLFKNDYYPYKQLASCYHQIKDYENELETILSFLNSGIYCDYYHYLFFLFNLKRLSQIFVVEDYEINDALQSFRYKSFKNKHFENTPAPIADRIRFEYNELKIVPYEEFKNQQDFKALDLELDLYESFGMLGSVNEILKTMIKTHNFNDYDLYRQICYNYQDLNDVESEIEIIKIYLKNDGGWNFQENKWFKDRLNELESIKVYPKPLKEPNFEIFYENNKEFLNYNDFQNNDNELTELTDKLTLKFKLRRKGWSLEKTDYRKAIDYHTSLLNHYLFKDDYYIYRRLVINYERINEFKLMFQTIESFFTSGIYCTNISISGFCIN